MTVLFFKTETTHGAILAFGVSKNGAQTLDAC